MQAYDTTSIDYNPLGDLFNNGNDGYNNGRGENGFNLGGMGGYLGGGGGLYNGGNGAYTPAPTPPGNDIKITLVNNSNFNNQMSFNIQNLVYNEGNQVVIDSKTINNELIIKPTLNDGFTIKNYYGLKTAMIDTSIQVIDLVKKTPVITNTGFSFFGLPNISSNFNLGGIFGSAFNLLGLNKNETTTVTKTQIVKKPGITLTTYDVNGGVQGTTNYTLPQTLDLGFDILANKVIKKTKKRIQSVFVISNYTNSKLSDELEIILSSSDLALPNKLKLGESVDIENINNISSDLSIKINGLSSFQLSNIRWQYANKFDSNSTFNVNDFNVLSSDNIATLSSKDFNANIILLVEVTPNTSKYASLTLNENIINVSIEESIFDSPTATKLIEVGYTVVNADSIKITTPYTQFTQTPTNKLVGDLKKHFLNNEGTFKILVTPYSNLYGDGITQTLIVNISKILDIPVINKIDYPTNVYIPTYSFGDVNFKISFESNLATHVLIYHAKENDNNSLGKFAAKDSINLNYKDLKNRKIINSPLDLLIVPYNSAIKGEIERITINFQDDGIYISTQNLKEELFAAIAAQLKLNLNKSKYLNHLASFDIEDKEIIISNWDVDTTTFTKFKTDELGNQIPDGEINKSVVLKLYEPLPTTINKNDTLWISELMALPILQSVILTGINSGNCVPLKAPNFGIELDFVKEQSTGFESYDNLILSGSTTSQQIVDKYLTENFIDVKGINIDYTDFSNFVKYSSAVERLANFRYKKELSEWYTNKINILNSGSNNSTIALNLDIKSYETKNTNLIIGFDGWETYLTQSIFTASFSEPSTLSVYNDYLSIATEYDRNNNNALKNNIPLHIVDDNENLDYLLFLDMIGNYFDIIWAYIKGMSDQKKISETNLDGIEDKFLYQYLQSFGWNPKNLNSNKQLWEYTFGLNGDGELSQYNTTYMPDDSDRITPEQATNQIWRRIANNLPYLLKHKGSIRGINALLTCYGIAASNLSIMEFGGPNADVVEDSPKFIYNSLTHNLVFDNISASLDIPFTGTPKPQSIEFKFKPTDFNNYTLLTGSGDFKLEIIKDAAPSVINGKYGFIRVNGSSVGTNYPFYDGNYHSILLNKSGSSLKVYAKTNDKDRIIQSGEWTKTINSVDYENTTTLKFTGFKGHLEEIRLWETNLSESVFNNHVIMPEAVNGNNLYSSTQDLLLRLDFEYPHKLSGSIQQIQSGSVKDYIKNVAPNVVLSNVTSSVKYGEYLLQSGYVAAVSASGFVSASSYPYNYEVLEREVALTIPNTGASRYYTNKVRLESQELTSNLSPLQRSTKKAFEDAPMDSNRVGLFFSPNKDLDLDIAKSLDGGSFDEYIGNPAYEYGYTNYPELDAVRNYYFERVGERNLYEFIRLIRYYDKSLFVNLREMLPARVIATTGLLIAPHLLERNRIKINRPDATAESLEGIVTETQITELTSTFDYKEANLNLTASIENISGINETLNGTLIASNTYNFNAEADSFTTTINTNLENVADGSYITYDGEIDYRRNESTLTTELDLLNAGQIVGMDNAYIDYGYGIYFNNGYGKHYYEENGIFKSKAIRAFLVTKESTNITNLTTNGISGSEANVITSSYSQKLIIQDGNQILNSASLYNDPKLFNTTPVYGYLPSHYIYKGDKHTSIENLFYKGCKQTINTTIDGKAAVETFTTNPTTLRVTAQGRSSNEPILEVD
jgi:hypothetical protein